MHDYNALLERILPQAEKPARYIGGEWNAVVKDADVVSLRICLAFPDLYELGLGNLGLQILYTVLNDMNGVWAERAYLPAPDMASYMRDFGLPLYMLESKSPVAQADGVGFTLQSELTYVNILKMLELSGISLRSADRDDAMPLVFAGGPGAYNPEPLSPFMDFFVVGDGEEAIVEIAEIMMRHKGASRQKQLAALADVQGVYVPTLHPTDTASVQAQFVASLDAAPYPNRVITPYTQLIHDGVGVEVLRGCTHGCRFCQAGMITRPVRERSIETILTLLDSTLMDSGLDDATLLSLSTCDYSQVRGLLRQVARQTHQHNIAVALPSIRLDRFAVELADYIAPVRRSGLTFAPEAGTARLRAVINKDVSDEQLVALAEEAFQRGWQHIKTYFMIGLPTETDADVDAIAALCVRVLEAGARIRPRAMVRTGVSTFVPKPFTPFQWARQISLEETREKQRRLADLLRPYRGIKFGRHAPEASLIEGLLSRADRRAADLIEAVLRHGGGYESWEEKLNFNVWQAAMAETGYDMVEQLAQRSLDSLLPWDFIDAQVTRAALLDEWQRAATTLHSADCRDGECRQCGASRRADASCRRMRLRAEEGRLAEAAITLESLPPSPPREGTQRLRFRVGRRGLTRFLSHLEFAGAWIRALRRAGAPLAYSQGFHAHPKVSFAAALPVGEESNAELMDVVLRAHCDQSLLLSNLRGALPEGLFVFDVAEVALRAPALMAVQSGLAYDLIAVLPPDEARRRLDLLMARDAWTVGRSVKHKGGRKTIQMDIRPLISNIALNMPEEGAVCFHFETYQHQGKLAKAREVAALLELDIVQVLIRKTDTFLA